MVATATHGALIRSRTIPPIESRAVDPGMDANDRRRFLRRLPASLAPLLVAGTLLRDAAAQPAGAASGKGRRRVVVMPKLVSIPYYEAVHQGVQAAAAELPGLAVQWLGPRQDSAEQQIELLERVLPTRPDLIAIAANDPMALSPLLQRAQRGGVRVMAWDADATPREFFVNLVDYTEFGRRLVEALVVQTGPRGEIAVVTTSFTAVNQVRWIQAIKRTLYARYPELRIVDIRPAGENTEEAFRVTQVLLAAHPRLVGLISLGVPNMPGVVRAVQAAGQAGHVAVTGNSTPSRMRGFLKDGAVRTVLLWNAQDHGYLTVYCAWQLLQGGLAPGRPFQAGRLGTLVPQPDAVNAQVSLPVLELTRDNVDRYRF